MVNYNYQKHNEAFLRLKELKQQGIKERVTVSLSCNPRIILSDPKLNTQMLSFEDYMKDPQKMLEIQCQFQEYSSNNMFSDKIMGFENIEGLTAYADFQNVLEADYYGCQVAYHGIYEPGTHTLLTAENCYQFLDKEFPDPFSGLVGKTFEYYEYFQQKIKEGYTYKGKPLTNTFGAGLGSDGPFTIACCLLGATEMCIALYEDQKFALELLDYITKSAIVRIKAGRKYYGIPEVSSNFGFADDSIAMLSKNDYEKFILPFHKQLKEELCTGENGIGVHLCGDATRHFKTMVDELDVRSFDTGFPVAHGKLVRELGPDIAIYGGVHIELLRNGTPEQVKKETIRILKEVMPYTKNFVMKEANNVSPETSPENLFAMYEAVLENGYYNDSEE
ncbi:MAG: uroporphyrinogen decarboxylase family protein [Oscillospiraceae bacterium]